MFFGSKILIFDAAGSQIRQNISLAVSLQFLYSILPKFQSACFLCIIYR